MSLFSRLAGTFATFFQLGGPAGPGLNDNAGAIEARNAANSAYAVMRGADPLGNNDLVTLEYTQAAGGNLGTQKVVYYNGQSQGAAPIAGNGEWGWCQFSTVGVTLAHPVLASTNKLTATSRTTYSATVSSQLGIRELGSLYAWRGNASGLGGFTMRVRFSLEAIGTSTTYRAMIGLIGVLGPLISVDWTTDTTISKIGMAFSAVSTAGNLLVGNWKIVEGSAAAVTAHDLGASFPLTAAHYLELILTCAPNDTKITYTVNNLTTGATASGTLNTTLPANNVFLCPYVQTNAQVGASGTSTFSVSNMVLVLNEG